MTFPAESRMTISDRPRLCRTATMRDPSGDQRGSDHCTSRVVAVIGAMRFPSGDTRTILVVAGSSCTATISPSDLTSGVVSLAPFVSRICFPFRSTNKSLRMLYGLVKSGCENRTLPSGIRTLGLDPLRRPSRVSRPASATR